MKQTSVKIILFITATLSIHSANADQKWIVAPVASEAASAPDLSVPNAPVLPIGARLYWLVQGKRGPVDYNAAAPGQTCDCSTSIVEDNHTYCTIPQWKRRVVECQPVK